MHRLIRLIFIAFTALSVLVSVVGYEQENPTEQEEESRLYFSAGRQKYIKMPDGTFENTLSGGVKAWHEDAILTAEEGVFLSGPREMLFYGNTVFRDSTRQLNADTLIYYERTREARALGRVKVTEKKRLLYADHVNYYKDSRILKTFGNVMVQDDSLRATMVGTEAMFNDSTGYGYVVGLPVFRREDNEGTVVIVTCSDTIEVLRDQKIIRLWKNVVITKDSLTATSALAVYDDSTETIILTGNPKATYATTTKRGTESGLRTISDATGDTVKVVLHERKVKEMDVVGSAVSTTTSTDSLGVLFDRSVIIGAVMRLFMDNNVVSLITTEGTAHSYYQRNSARENEMFINVADGDTLTFYFTNGKTTRINISGHGGGPGKGEYYKYKPKVALSKSDSTAIPD